MVEGPVEASGFSAAPAAAPAAASRLHANPAAGRLRKENSVRTLQLEMDHIYRSLEDEALDMTAYDSGVGDEGVWRGLHLHFFLGLDGWSAMGCRLSSDAALLTYREGYISLL